MLAKFREGLIRELRITWVNPIIKAKVLSFCAFVVLLAVPVFGDEQTSTSVTPVAARDQKSTPPTLTFDFPGGTLAQFIEKLKQIDAPINLIVDKADENAAIPPFSLRNVAPQSLAEPLHSLLHRRGLTLTGGNILIQGTNTVYYVSRDAGSLQVTRFAPYQLWPQLEYQTIDDIVTAIRAAWELNPAHNPTDLKLKFHPATSLLLVDGPQDAIEIATRVIGSLKAVPPNLPPKSKEQTTIPKT